MYKFFSEELFAAKVFLTAALHEPVMFLLSQDELFLDIDPAKSILRFSAAERVRRFGSDENSEDYINKVAEHRKTVEDKLVLITNHFLQSIRSAMTLFPSRLLDLHGHGLHLFSVFRNCSSRRDWNNIRYAVEHIARFNLIQVGQVMQNLALLPYEVPAPQMHRLLVKLDNDLNASCRKVCVGTLQEIKIILASLNHSAVNQITDVRLHKKLENEIKKLPVELKSNRTEVLILPVSENNDALLRYREAYSVADIKGSPVDTYHDPKNLEKCKAFLDAKRKLRSVLSSALTLCLHLLLHATTISGRISSRSCIIREVQRCLIVLGNEESEHQERASHISRLQNLRASLLQLNYYLFRTKTRIQREKALSAECLLEILVRFFLEGKDLFLRQFVHDFRCLKAQDERTKTVEQALRFLNERFYIEPMWRFATSDNLDYAQKCLERSLMAHVYKFAMFPNGDADHSRDAIFYKSIQKLSLRLTITHPDLGILKKYHGECPWPSAQAEIAIINAYKSPCDKIGCVVRCCETIENLISLSSDVGTANPPTLLSNIQYINDFYADRMQGQAAYWWTQFAASVEFLKQLLNRHL
uniref:VPS9 domain-containing protein n=1 Tax=Ditylenchus dipsaci TaxID=166011 RepID=A0A915EB59_9BILA